MAQVAQREELDPQSDAGPTIYYGTRSDAWPWRRRQRRREADRARGCGGLVGICSAEESDDEAAEAADGDMDEASDGELEGDEDAADDDTDDGEGEGDDDDADDA